MKMFADCILCKGMSHIPFILPSRLESYTRKRSVHKGSFNCTCWINLVDNSDSIVSLCLNYWYSSVANAYYLVFFLLLWKLTIYLYNSISDECGSELLIFTEKKKLASGDFGSLRKILNMPIFSLIFVLDFWI